MPWCDYLQVKIHDLAPLEIVVEEVDDHAFRGSGALGEVFVLGYDAEGSVAEGQVLGARGLLGLEIGDARGTDGGESLLLLVQQVIEFVFRLRLVIVVIAAFLRIFEFHPSHLFLRARDRSILLLPLPLLLLLPRRLNGLRAPQLVSMHLPVRRPGGGAIGIVLLVRLSSVLLLQFLHRLLDALLNVDKAATTSQG